MNWVDRRALRDKAVAQAAPQIWSDLCAAVVDAIESYNRKYVQATHPAVEYHNKQSNRLRVTKLSNYPGVPPTETPEQRSMVMVLDAARQSIKASFEPETRTEEFHIDADGEAKVFLVHIGGAPDPDRIGRDELDRASEILLARMLFGNGPTISI